VTRPADPTAVVASIVTASPVTASPTAHPPDGVRATRQGLVVVHDDAGAEIKATPSETMAAPTDVPPAVTRWSAPL